MTRPMRPLSSIALRNESRQCSPVVRDEEFLPGAFKRLDNTPALGIAARDGLFDVTRLSRRRDALAYSM